MTDEPAARIAEAYVESMSRRARHVPGGEVVELDGIVMAFTNLPDEAQNGGFLVREPADPAGAIAAAEAEADRRGQPLGLEVERDRFPAAQAALRSAGLRPLFSRPAMAMDPERIHSPLAPSSLQIDPVDDETKLSAMVSVEVEAFDTAPAVADGLLRAVVADPQTKAFVAMLDGAPVAEAIAVHHHATVGVFGIGVRTAARRRGIGAAITVAAVRAFPDADLAWLVPTEMGERVYERLGFRAVAPWDVWTCP